ncbi:hypothetical protein [uncultured Parolsenella sp.]|uniref:hypothetical protein n=1 Tax=uncultured Parolsenella sp. TaxID=2083008 RepID=UPI0027D9B547|nr:hypothetical protein [uncultured Parolsenella sp.]
MRRNDELVERLAWHRRERIGNLSERAFDELRLAVQQQPENFLDRDDDRAFSLVCTALAASRAAQAEEEFLDDEAYESARAKRFARLGAACREALDVDPNCLDAKILLAIVSTQEADAVLQALDTTWEEVGAGDPSGWTKPETLPGLFARPRLRLLAARSRYQLDTARYRPAISSCELGVLLDPTDELGLRYTWAVGLARLEDEAGFDQLDAKFERQGNAWSHLARTLLMYKLDRMGAARRALRGYASLCTGGAYALLKPAFVETYLPTRPDFVPGSYEEATLAVHECDPVVMDTPDFLAWAGAQEGFTEQAKCFADDHDLDW